MLRWQAQNGTEPRLKPTVYLHIGMPKTGSSALQHFCQVNQPALSERGCLYPVSGRGRFDHHSQFRFAAAGWDYGFYYLFLKWKGFPDWYGRSPGIDESRVSLFEEIEQTRATSVLLSSEWFSIGVRSGDMRRLKHLFGDLPVRPVMYVRPQDQAIQSFYAELIKNPHMRFNFDFKPHWMKYIPFFNYYREYRRWGRVFGTRNMIVRCYDQLLQGDINRDFFDMIGVELDGLELPQRINPHVSPQQIRALRESDHQALDIAEYRQVLSEHAEASSSHSGFATMSADQTAAIRRYFARSNRRLAQQVFGRDDLFVSDRAPAGSD